MKKIMILTAAVLALGFVTPQITNAMKAQNEIAVVQDKVVKYQEIKVAEIPVTVSKAITAAYAGYTVDKAFLGDDTSYKANVSMGDLKYVVFYTAKGELIKVEEPVKKKVEEPVK